MAGDFGISTGEAYEEGGEILVPIKFRGVNNPGIFISAFNAMKSIFDKRDNFFDFIWDLAIAVKNALRKSK